MDNPESGFENEYEGLDSIEKALFEQFSNSGFPKELRTSIDAKRADICKSDSSLDDCYENNHLMAHIRVDCDVFCPKDSRESDIEITTRELLHRRFGKALPIVAKDFTSAMFHQLAGRPTSDDAWAEHCDQGLRCIVARIAPNCERSVGEANFDLGTFADTSDGGLDFEEQVLWEHKKSFRLVALISPVEGLENVLPVRFPRCKVTAEVQGWASEVALGSLEQFLGGWVSTVAEILRESATNAERCSTDDSSWLDAYWSQRIRDSSVLVTYLCSPESAAIWKGCLGSLVRAKPILEGTLQRRLMNALTLFREAKSQTLPAVGLTLCFCAIEAMVNAGKKISVDHQISQRVPDLLTHGIGDRADAKKVIKGLYEVRSVLAHGDEVEAAPELFRIAKRLTAGVIRAACSWIDMRASQDDRDQTWRDFLSDLNDVEWEKKQHMHGVQDMSDLFPRFAAIKNLLPKK